MNTGDSEMEQISGELEQEIIKSKKSKPYNLRNWFLYIVFAMILLVFTILDPRFISLSNLANIGRQVAMVAIMGLGMTFVLTAAHVDLSVGSVLSLTGMIGALGVRWGLNIVVASILGVMVGIIFGLINGLIVSKVRIPSFLVTLGTMSIARGIALTITGTDPIVIFNKQFKILWGAGDIFHIPYMFLWVLVIFIISIFIYNYTIYGNHLRATVGSLEAAKFSGVNTTAVTVKAFIFSGICASIAGLIMTSRLGAARPDVGAGMELDAIAAVIIGGTSLFGGKGSIPKTLLGALIITTITNGLIILGVPSPTQRIIMGVLVIAAVSFSERD